jgi:pilus assembly protein Flp/PilA
MKTMFGKLLSDEGGVTAIEYAFVASMIAMAIVVAVGMAGTSVASTFSTIASSF